MTDQSHVPAKVAQAPSPSMFDPDYFNQLQRIGKMLASSIMFPDHLRKGTPEQAAANGALVADMAHRMNERPLVVAQSIYIVGGRPSWSTQYMIARANQHGTFSDQIDWEVEGKGDSLSVTAFATLAKTGRKVSMTCDMGMAKAENWTKNAKYQSMPEVMLRYRSAAFLIRMYCPEVMVGIPTQVEVELESIRDVTPPSDASPVGEPYREPEQVVEDAEEVEDDPKDAETKDAAAKETGDDGNAQDQAKTTAGPDLTQFRDLTNMILADIEDAGSNPSGVLELYGPQIEQIKDAAPDMAKEIEDAIKAAEAND